jgi:hypothetical protein
MYGSSVSARLPAALPAKAKLNNGWGLSVRVVATCDTRRRHILLTLSVC